MKKCDYCQDEVRTDHIVIGGQGGVLNCCSDACAEKALSFCQRFDRSKKYFIAGIVSAIVILFISVFFLSAGSMDIGAVLMALSLSILGAMMIVFPFATPQTFASLGIRKTVVVTRALGICMIAIGLILGHLVRS